MTDAATPLLTGLPAALPARLGAGHRWMRCLVVHLHLARDVGSKDGLEPLSGTAAANPRVSGSHGAPKAGGNLRGSQGKAFVPGHGRILPRKIKCAMRKIILATGYALRRIRA
jgi:hypothetical protein